MRGFGYKWSMHVEQPVCPVTATATSALETSKPPSRNFKHTLLSSITLVIAMTVGTIYSLRSPSSLDHDQASSPTERTTLVLPVMGTEDPDDAWVRFGVADFIVRRMRSSGQPTVPMETAIALMKDLTLPLDRPKLNALREATRASAAVEVHASRHANFWKISLDATSRAEPTLHTEGEAKDIIEAARDAADRTEAVEIFARSSQQSIDQQCVTVIAPGDAYWSDTLALPTNCERSSPTNDGSRRIAVVLLGCSEQGTAGFIRRKDRRRARDLKDAWFLRQQLRQCTLGGCDQRPVGYAADALNKGQV